MVTVGATCVVVADSLCARFFSLHLHEAPPTEGRSYMAMHPPEARKTCVMQEHAALYAAPGRSNPSVRHDMGRSFESGTAARHIIAPHTEDKMLDQAALARRITARIAQEWAEGAFERVILVAPERLLGILRQQWPAALNTLPLQTVTGEWANLPRATLQNRLCAMVAPVASGAGGVRP